MIPPPRPGLRHLIFIVAEEFPKIHPILRHFVWHLRNVRLRGCLFTFQSSSWIITPCVLSVTVLSTFWRLLVVCLVMKHTQFLISKYTKGRCNFTHWKSELLPCRYQRWCALLAYFPSLKGTLCRVVVCPENWNQMSDFHETYFEDCAIGSHSYAVFLNFLPSLLNI